MDFYTNIYMSNRIVLHVDFDYFYAQCEEIRNQELKTKPVCVCVYSDRGEDTGAIATANYNARNYGVKSGMPIKLAKIKLKNVKDVVFLPTDFNYYEKISEKAMKIIQDFADIFEYVGKDEAYLDITKKSQSDYNNASHIAQKIKNAIRSSLNLTCSIGISSNKLVAKIASDYKKPDGLTVVPPERMEAFLESIKISDIPGIGSKTEKKLQELKINSIKDLKKLSVFDLNKIFGRKTAEFIFKACRGLDDEPVSRKEPSVQFSKIITLKEDSKDFEFLQDSLLHVCKQLHKTILQNKKQFKSIGIQFVQSDLSNKTKSKMLKNPSSDLDILEKTSLVLLKEALTDQEKKIRRLGVKVSELSDIKGQLSMDNYF